MAPENALILGNWIVIVIAILHLKILPIFQFLAFNDVKIDSKHVEVYIFSETIRQYLSVQKL